VLSLRYEGSPGNVALAELADDLGYLAPVKLDYVGDNMTGGPHSIQAVLTGDLDIGGSFNGAIVKLVAARAPITSVIAAYGTDEQSFQGFYALEGSMIRGPRDFIGKKVIARMESIILKRKRNEDTSIVKHWTSATVGTPRGRLENKDFQIWIDWLVQDGQISRGQIQPADIYTNQFQPKTLAER